MLLHKHVSDNKVKIGRIIILSCILFLFAYQIWLQLHAPFKLILHSIAILAIPLLIIALMRWVQTVPKRIDHASCAGLILVGLYYTALAIRTWITGALGFTAGISSDYAGWYVGSALLGCLLFLVAGILNIHAHYRLVTISLQLLMAVLVFVGGSPWAILWLAIISLFLILLRVAQASGKSVIRRMGLVSLFMLFIILLSPFFYTNAVRRNERTDPLPNPVVASDSLPTVYAEAKTGNHALGYLSYQDMQAIDQSLATSGISPGRADKVLHNYLSIRYQTVVEDLQLRELKQRQFLRASLQAAGPLNWLAGFGMAWFTGFLDPISQGILQIIAIWGLTGLILFATPFIVFLYITAHSYLGDKRKMLLLLGQNIMAIILLLSIFVSWDGIILHPLLLFLLYLPAVLLLNKPQEFGVTDAEHVKTTAQHHARRMKLLLTVLVMILFAVLFFGIFLSVRVQAVSVLRRSYRIIAQTHDRITASLSAVRPGKWQPTYQPEIKPPMVRYETVSKENDAESIINGRYKGFVFGSEIDWDLPGIENPSTQYQYHGMFWLDSCLRAWKETSDQQYIQSALDMVFSWLERFPTRSSDDPPYAWNDDSTARRVFYLCNAYTDWYSEMTEEQRVTLRRALAYQAELLSQGTFYTWYHNHGLFQDRALLLYTQVFDDPDNDRYQAICKDRIMTYVQKAVTSDGVNTEHSPSYHLVIVNLLQTMADFLDQVDQAFSQTLREDVVDKMRDYATWLVRPDGQYPPLGDSSTAKVVINNWLTDPYYLYAATNGVAGTVPEPLDRVYPEGGYAIFRNSWLFDGQASWVMFVAATHGGSHKHHDDLSFMIWHHGDLFTDGGNGGYDYFGKTLALYGVSPWAHSTLVSNWLDRQNAHFYKYRPYIDAKGLETGITDWSISKDKSTVSGIQKRIAGIEQVRTLTYDKQNNLVTIKDAVTSKNQEDSHLFLFQLAEGIEADTDTNEITLMRQGQPTATIAFKSALTYDIIILTGDEHPLIQAFRADTGAVRTVIGVRFDHVSEPFELLTTINLLP